MKRLEQQFLKFSELVRYFDEESSENLLFEDPQRGSWQERFRFHSSGYLVRAKKAMEQMYQVFPLVVGEEAWAELGVSYLDEQENLNCNLNFIGDQLPDYLRENAASKDLVDLAELERTVTQCFHAKEEPVDFEKTDVQCIHENTKFEFKACCSLFYSESNVPEVWMNRGKLGLKESPQYLLLYREQYRVYGKLLEAKAYRFFECLQNSMSLSTAVSSLNLEARELQQLISMAFSLGIIRSIKN